MGLPNVLLLEKNPGNAHEPWEGVLNGSDLKRPTSIDWLDPADRVRPELTIDKPEAPWHRLVSEG
jgi:hypothetical protein